MSDNTLAALPWALITAQPNKVRGLSESERDALTISANQVDGEWIIVSRYVDDVWHLNRFSSNVPINRRSLDFGTVPSAFRAVMKAMMYRYLRRGRRAAEQPKGATVRQVFLDTMPFLRHLEAQKIDRLSAVTPMIATTYVVASKAFLQNNRSQAKPLSQRGLQARFQAVEAIHELSQYTQDQMPQHPWPNTSATAMVGLLGHRKLGGMTPLIPDDVFCVLFDKANQNVERGQHLLDLRDELDAAASLRKGLPACFISYTKRQRLRALGWEGSLRSFNSLLNELRTSCYIVLASTSGCRNHELANLQSGAHHRTQDDEGTLYHWMRSRSDKTDTGIHDWMIPEAAVRALRVMERWSTPYQALISAEILQRRCNNPHDSQIAEAQLHRHSLFLGLNQKRNGQVRTLTVSSWDTNLKSFAKSCGLNWTLSSHQFRRKFANYAAQSRFGDLRYLKEHYAHWSMDMTLGYAMDDSWGQHLDLDLYADIQGELEDIKIGVVENWLGQAPLAGSYGRALNHWQREPQNLLIFKDHSSMLKSIAESTSIRSNGHAWCTADQGGCVGNTIDRTRCGGCDNAVIGRGHAPIYLRLYNDLQALLHCKDIGEGGRQRVKRDLNRCRDVLAQLGMDLET